MLALLAATLSGCGTGQIAQTAAQEPAVNGNKVNINNVLLRDIRIQAAQTGDFVHPGRSVDLVLVAINQSPDVADRLVGITSDIGTVAVSGDGRLPAGGMLFLGPPEGQRVAPGPLESNNAVQGDREPDQADQQRPDVQLHLHLREGRAGHRAGADFGRVGCSASLTA